MTAVLATGAVALFVGLVGTSVLIRWFRGHGIGQPIDDAVAQHASKAGTPTAGRGLAEASPPSAVPRSGRSTTG